MSDYNQPIDPRNKKRWDETFKQYGIKVMPETAMFYEMEEFFPSYIFTDMTIPDFGEDVTGTGIDKISGRIAFFKQNGEPLDGELRWYEIEPMNVYLTRLRMQDMTVERATRCGVDGYIIPLQESAFFSDWVDVNAYLHNLMFWEGMLSPDVSGPLAQRITWLTQKLYSMRCDQRESIIRLNENGVHGLNIDTDSTSTIIEYALSQKQQEMNYLIRKVKEEAEKEKTYKDEKERMEAEHKRDLLRSLVLKVYDMMEETERFTKDSAMRQEMLQRQMIDLQHQIVRETEITRDRKSSYNEFWEKMSQTLEAIYRDEK